MTVSEQNTLEQIMHNKLDKEGRFTRVLTDAEIYDCVREWLQQYKLPDNHPIVTATINMLLLRLEK